MPILAVGNTSLNLKIQPVSVFMKASLLPIQKSREISWLIGNFAEIIYLAGVLG